MDPLTYSADAAPTPIFPRAEKKSPSALPINPDAQRESVRSRLRPALAGHNPGYWASDHRREVEHNDGWVYIAVHSLCLQAVQAVPSIIEQDDDGQTRVHKRSHPRHKLLSQPNPHQDGDLLRYALTQQLALTGTALIWTVRNRLGVPRELYCVPTPLAVPQPPMGTHPYGSYRIAPLASWETACEHDGYVPAGILGQLLITGAILDVREVTPVRWPHHLWLSDGLSPLSAGARAVDIAEQSEWARWAALKNSSHPGLVIEPPLDLNVSPEDRESFRQDLTERHAGTGKTGKDLLLLPGMKVVSKEHTPVEMDYSGSWSQIRDSVLALYGTPAIAAGISEAGSYAAFFASLKQYTELRVNPTMSLLAKGLGRATECRAWSRTEVRLEAKAVDDPDQKQKDRANEISAWGNPLTQQGTVKVDEHRKFLGLSPLGGTEGDKLIVGEQKPTPEMNVNLHHAPGAAPGVKTNPMTPEKPKPAPHETADETTTGVEEPARVAMPKSPTVSKGFGPHKFSSTQFNVADAGYSRTQGSPLDKLVEMARAIPDADLAEDGREDHDLHITIKYGLHTGDGELVRRVVQGFGPVTLKLGKVSLFENDDADVVKVDVESEQLRKLNALLSESLANTDTHPTYIPHICLAYVKPGAGRKYTRNNLVEGMEIGCTRLVFSDQMGQRQTINLVEPFKINHDSNGFHLNGYADRLKTIDDAMHRIGDVLVKAGSETGERFGRIERALDDFHQIIERNSQPFQAPPANTRPIGGHKRPVEPGKPDWSDPLPPRSEHDHRLNAWLAGRADIPEPIYADAMDHARDWLDTLEIRYGQRMAHAIATVGVVSLPIPEDGLAVIDDAPVVAVAEVLRSERGTKSLDLEEAAGAGADSLSEGEIEEAGREWIAALLRAWRMDEDVPAGRGELEGKDYDPHEPRDSTGKWGVGGSGAAAPVQPHHERLHKRAAKAARKVIDHYGRELGRVTDKPVLKQLKAASKWCQKKTSQLYGALEARYGRKTAIACMASGQAFGWGATGVGAVLGVPIYIPGSTIVGALPAVAVAETYLQLRRLVKRGAAKSHDPDAPAERVNVRELGEQLARDLEEAYKDWLAENREEMLAAFQPGREAKGWDESQHPRGQPENAGEFGAGGGGGGKKPTTEAPSAKPPSKMAEQARQIVGKIKSTKERAFAGKQVETEKISKQLAGAIGEQIIIEHLKSLGFKDAGHLSDYMETEQNNLPADLIHDHQIVEVKTGQASNGGGAQQWRLTIGEPGKEEKDWLASASAEDKAAHNAKKQADIHERKKKAIAGVSKELGFKVAGKTMTVILDPAKKIADLFEFDGFHDRLGWTGEQAQQGYIRSVKYG